MKQRHALCGALLAASAAACADSTTAPQPMATPSSATSELTVDAGATYDQVAAEILAAPTDGAGVQQSASGHAEAVGKSTIPQHKYAFSAIKHQDGTVTGRFVVHDLTASSNATAQGEVTCLEAEAVKVGTAQARIGGIITHATVAGALSFPIGLTVTWSVTDVGEPSNEQDLASLVLIGSPCVPAGQSESINGNIQVRP